MGWFVCKARRSANQRRECPGICTTVHTARPATTYHLPPSRRTSLAYSIPTHTQKHVSSRLLKLFCTPRCPHSSALAAFQNSDPYFLPRVQFACHVKAPTLTTIVIVEKTFLLAHTLHLTNFGQLLKFENYEKKLAICSFIRILS